MTSIASARLILLLFAAAQALVAWSIRFLPRPIENRLTAGIVKIGVVATLLAILFGELSFYLAATGHVPLKNDNPFQIIFLTQHVIALLIIFDSDSVLRRKATESRIDPGKR